MSASDCVKVRYLLLLLDGYVRVHPPLPVGYCDIGVGDGGGVFPWEFGAWHWRFCGSMSVDFHV